MLFFYFDFIICSVYQLDVEHFNDSEIRNHSNQRDNLRFTPYPISSNLITQNKKNNRSRELLFDQNKYSRTNPANAYNKNKSDNCLNSKNTSKPYCLNHEELSVITSKDLLDTQNPSLGKPIGFYVDTLCTNGSSNKKNYDSNKDKELSEIKPNTDKNNLTITKQKIEDDANIIEKCKLHLYRKIETSEIYNFIDDKSEEIIDLFKSYGPFRKEIMNSSLNSTKKLNYEPDEKLIKTFKSRNTIKIYEYNKNNYIEGICTNLYRYSKIEFVGNIENITYTCLNITIAFFLSNIPNSSSKKMSIKPEFHYLARKKSEFIPLLHYIIKHMDCDMKIDQDKYIADFNIILTNIQVFTCESILFTEKQKNPKADNVEVANYLQVLSYRYEIIIYQILSNLLNQKIMAGYYDTLTGISFHQRDKAGFSGYEKKKLYLFTIFLINDAENLPIDYNNNNIFYKALNRKKNLLTFFKKFRKLIVNFDLDLKSKASIFEVLKQQESILQKKKKTNTDEYNEIENDNNIKGMEMIKIIYEKFIEILDHDKIFHFKNI